MPRRMWRQTWSLKEDGNYYICQFNNVFLNKSGKLEPDGKRPKLTNCYIEDANEIGNTFLNFLFAGKLFAFTETAIKKQSTESAESELLTMDTATNGLVIKKKPENSTELDQVFTEYLARCDQNSTISTSTTLEVGDASFDVKCVENQGPFGGSEVTFSQGGNNYTPTNVKNLVVFGNQSVGKRKLAQALTLGMLLGQHTSPGYMCKRGFGKVLLTR